MKAITPRANTRSPLKTVLRMWLPVAVLFIVGAAALSWRRDRALEPFVERGVVAAAEVIGWRTGSCTKGTGRYATYRYTVSDGRTFTREHGCYGHREAGPRVVTYLPEDPERHFPGDVRRVSRWRGLGVAVLFSSVGSLVLLVFGVGVQAWISRRRS